MSIEVSRRTRSIDGCLTVSELKDWLAQFDGDMMVVVPGAEGGLQPLRDIRTTPVMLNVNSDPAFGPHDVPGHGAAADTRALVLLSRRWMGS